MQAEKVYTITSEVPKLEDYIAYAQRNNPEAEESIAVSKRKNRNAKR